MSLQDVELFDSNVDLYASMLKDMEHARHFIYLEVFRFNIDVVGEKFRDILAIKALEGVSVKVVVDSWGTEVNETFFAPIRRAGGEVRFYKKIKLFTAYFAKNHCRNHRKLLVIDDSISYIGSSNISGYSMTWKELNLRITDVPLAKNFVKAFDYSFDSYKIYNLKRFSFKKDLHCGDLTIMQEVPAIHRQRLKKRYEHLIQSAQKSVTIETPYFLPGYRLRKVMMEAVRRGVKVTVITPKHSDVFTVEIIRRHYLGQLFENGIDLQLYEPGNLHAKGLLIDDEIFSVSSANFDYRSFRYQYEISLIGHDAKVRDLLLEHLNQNLAQSNPFDYEKWEKRGTLEKLLERILLPFRYLM